MTEKKIFLMFDLDNTILDFDKAEAAALTKTFNEMGIEPLSERLALYSRINKRHWELLEDGVLTREEVLVGRFDVLFKELGLDCSGPEAEKKYENYLGRGHYFVEGAEKLLDTLYGRYELYIVSNGCASVQAGRLKSSGIKKYFKDIFISELIGCDKPSPEFFRRCFDRIPGFSRERALIIGDSLTSDIRGAVNAGVKSCWFNPKGEGPRQGIQPDYEVSSLMEIPELVQKIF
ncbi:MAG: YjjG family noncanonical pyrimidine nucleotidase [Candidatus Limivicinus sp.]|jgi:2-haloacid dehalogenase